MRPRRMLTEAQGNCNTPEFTPGRVIEGVITYSNKATYALYSGMLVLGPDDAQELFRRHGARFGLVAAAIRHGLQLGRLRNLVDRLI